MAEPRVVEDLSDEGQQEVATAREYQDLILQALEEPDFAFDRVPLDAAEFKSVLEVFAAWPAAVRANTYAFVQQAAVARGTESLHDIEIQLLAWAPQDHLATEAVEQGDDNRFLYNPKWYTEYVSFNGSMGDARDAILDMDGWEEPGFLGRTARTGIDMAGGLMTTVPDRVRDRPEYLIGRGVGSGSSRLTDLLDVPLAVDRQDIAAISTTEDKISDFAESSAVILASLAVLPVAMGTAGKGLIKTPWVSGVVGSGFIQKVVNSKPVQATTRFIQSFGGATPHNDKPLTLFQQQLASLSAKTGLPVDTFFQLPRSAFSNPNLYGPKPAKVAGAVLIFNNVLDVAGGYLLADQYDKVWAARRANELMEQGADEPAAVQQATDEAIEIRQTEEPLNPLQADIEFDSEKQVGALVASDSPATTMLDNFLASVDEDVAVATQRVNDAAEYEATVKAAEAEPRNRQAGEERMPAPDPDAVDLILTGDSELSDFDEFITANEIKTEAVMEELGLEFFDEDTMDIDMLEEEGYTITQDHSAPKATPRMILLPPDMTAPQFGQYLNQWDENLIEDPMIRVPEGYSARTFDLKPKLGEMDRWEADFISRGQDSSLVYEEAEPRDAIYRDSHVLDQINSMSYSRILEFQSLAAEAGFYGDSRAPFTEGYMTEQDQQIVATVMGQANVDGEFFFPMLKLMAENPGRYRQVTQETAAKGPTRLPYSIPLALRHVPGPKTIAEETKARFKDKLGRDPLQTELDAVAADLSGYHATQNQELIALDMARYAGDNQGMITGAQFQAIEDPGAAASFDISEKWVDEINLNERRESNSDSFGRMLNATLGGRSTIGAATAAGNVQAIGRAS